MDTSNKYGTYKVQKELLCMIKDIHKFCVEQKIAYSLCGGSLLGAIREKGFIPWDDDMDISLDRKSYEKFIVAFKDNEKYDIMQDIWVPRIVQKQDPDNGACVDIFVFDNVPENSIISSIKIFAIKTLQGMMKKADLRDKKYSFIDRVLLAGTYLMGRLFGFETKKKLYVRVSKIGNKKESSFINAYNAFYKLLRFKYPAEIINSYKEVPFEDTMVSVMEGYDTYLTLQYGDYMTPPDEAERVPQHIRG